MRAERRVPRDITNSQNGGIAISGSIKRKKGSGDRVVLDFPPEEDRPRGHTGKKDLIVSL